MRQRLLLVPQCESPRVTEHWRLTKDGDPFVKALHERHYSSYQYKDGRTPMLFIGPGEKTVLATEQYDAAFGWRFFTDDFLKRPSLWCTFFRNESDVRSSTLILEAERVAKARWVDEDAYTIINPNKVRSSNPGCCYFKAGWVRFGLTAKGLIVLTKPSSKLGVETEPA